MSTNRKRERSPDEHAAMFKFLEAYDNRSYPDDVGCLLGQLSLLRERAPASAADARLWHKAVSLAVAAA